MEKSKIEDLEDYLNVNFPETLYHYTNLNGLQGIIQSSEIWFSNLYFLNDSSEYQLGLNLIIKQLETYKEGFSVLRSTKYFIEALEKAIIFLRDKQPPYILSLTANDNLLSQWRGYTNNGVGVNIGFKSSFFIDKKINIFKCIYEPEKQKAIVEKIVSDAIFMFISISDTQGIFKNSEEKELTIYDNAITIAGRHFMKRTSLFCSLIKDQSFYEEDEWRALMYNDEQPFFLNKSNYFKPYKKFIIEDLNSIIEELTIGPNSDKELCFLSIEMLLKKYQIETSKIKSSNIPYRN